MVPPRKKREVIHVFEKKGARGGNIVSSAKRELNASGSMSGGV
jgi:hypothetical protein